MFLEETTGYPLVNGHSDHLSKCKHSWLFFIELLCLLNSLEEESDEGFKRVLIHVINDTQCDKQEVKHGTLSGNSTIDFTKDVNLDFSVLGNELLSLNFS